MRVTRAFTKMGNRKSKELRLRCFGCGTTKGVQLALSDGNPTCSKCRQAEVFSTVDRKNPVHE